MKIKVAMSRYDGNEIYQNSVEERFEILIRDLKSAFGNFDDVNTLYVYIAPEYFFRKHAFSRSSLESTIRRDTIIAKTQGISNIYGISLEEYQKLENHYSLDKTWYESTDYYKFIRLFREYTKDKSLLCIPGTIWWKPSPRKGKILNTAVAFYNGEVVCQHDKINNVGEMGSDELHPDGCSFKPGRNDSGIFNIIYKNHELKCGIEICGDHSDGILSSTNIGKTLDLHIVTANTVAIEPCNVCIKPTGFFILCSATTNANVENMCRRGNIVFDLQLYSRSNRDANLVLIPNSSGMNNHSWRIWPSQWLHKPINQNVNRRRQLIGAIRK